jgi:cellulose synthase/poly-beta-1,6-N-acetylglucosamine synthase-like glycosyltransferase
MMQASNVLFLVLGAVVLLVTLPGTLELLFLTLGAGRKAGSSRDGRLRDTRLAIVVPAHNEAGLIGRCVASIAASAPSPGYREIVVVADNCTDETAKLAAEAGARVLVRQNEELRGKGYALRLAFDQLGAEGFDAFLVVDADSMVSSNLVCEVVERLGAGAAAVQCRYRVANESASLRARLMDVAFLAFNVLRPRGRSGWGVSAGILGNGFGLRGETLQKVPYTAASIVEDLEYHLRLVAASEKVDFVDGATVFGEIPAGNQAARAQRSRWEGGRLRMAGEWAPRLIAGIARGQWRLTEPLFDLLTLPLAYQVLLLSLAIFLPAPFRQYSVVALGVVALHVLCASLFGEQPLKTVLALASAPFYILWKVTTLDAVLSASRREARWVRTGRDNEAGLRIAK